MLECLFVFCVDAVEACFSKHLSK